ncbi:hypothetical protein EfmAA242_10230 [Enterococcus faecium]|nr:hypothetical protein EfmAA242_10230 [Enterococcus faecium]
MTESEIADRLLAACPNLRQGYQLYQDILYAVKKRDQSLSGKTILNELLFMVLDTHMLACF